MKRLHAYTHLLCPAFVIGCFVALMLVWAGAVALASQPASVSQVGAAMPPGGVLASQYVPGISCTLSITTEQDFTYQDTSTTFADAAAFPALSTYYDELALSFGDVPPGNSLKFPVFDEYFRLDNATLGASYKVDAIPDYTTNYNLGLIIYDVSFSPIMADTNAADNYGASLTLVPDSVGPYYFKIVQLTPVCTGRTYTFRVTYTSPTATPTSTPTATGSPTPTPTATPAWTSPDQYDSSTYAPNYNDNLAHAVALGASTTSGLTLYNAVLHPSDPGDDQDWYAIYGLAGYQYSVSAAPDIGYIYPYLFMEVLGPDRTTLIGRVPASDNPSISWTANSIGLYYIHIARASGSPTYGTYHITWTSGPHTATPTSMPPNGPTATPTATPSVPPPVSAFTASPRSGYPPLIVKFTDQSSGLITGRLWRFGDGMMSTLQDPTYAYPASGAYTVALTVSGPGGGDTFVRTNYIRAYLPQPIFSEPVCGTTNNSFQIISGLAPYGFTIKLYDDGTQLSTAATTLDNTYAFVTFFVSGRHVLTTTATNTAGTGAPSFPLVLAISPTLAYDPVGVTFSYAPPAAPGAATPTPTPSIPPLVTLTAAPTAPPVPPLATPSATIPAAPSATIPAALLAAPLVMPFATLPATPTAAPPLATPTAMPLATLPAAPTVLPWGVITEHPRDSSGCANPDSWRVWVRPSYTTIVAVPVRYTRSAIITVTLGNQTRMVADTLGTLHFPLTTVFTPPITSGLFAITVTADGQTSIATGSVVMDSEGYVYDKNTWDSQGITQTLAGVTVTCQYSDTAANEWMTWAAWAYDHQINPLVTGADGYYSFFVPPGTYRITANHPDYWPYASPDIVVWDKPAHVNIPLILTRRLYLPIILRQ